MIILKDYFYLVKKLYFSIERFFVLLPSRKEKKMANKKICFEVKENGQWFRIINYKKRQKWSY